MTGEIEFVCSWLFVHLFSCVARVSCLGDALLPLQHRDGASGLGQVQRAPQTHDAAAHNDDGRRRGSRPPPHLLLLWRGRTEEDGGRRRTKVWLENTRRMRVNGERGLDVLSIHGREGISIGIGCRDHRVFVVIPLKVFLARSKCQLSSPHSMVMHFLPPRPFSPLSSV